MIKDESLYLAGPVCFYENGYGLWQAWRKEAEFYGFNVALPNDSKLEYEEGNLRDFSAAIFRNCRDSINKTTGIIASLESYRGTIPDGGTVYEIGMAYAKGAKCYAYTRDKRPIGVKYGLADYRGMELYDLEGRKLAHKELPFGPCLVGSCKIVEGDIGDALKAYMADLEEVAKLEVSRNLKLVRTPAKVTLPRADKPIVYLAGIERFENNADERYAEMKAICAEFGLIAISPLDPAPGVEDIETTDPIAKAYKLFDRYQQHVRNCDIILANLNDYHGKEPNDDVSFECGMAFQLGKKLFAYRESIAPMIDLIPNSGEANDFRDVNGMNVENFQSPVNLMFGASFQIYDGDFREVVRKMSESLRDNPQRPDLVAPILD